MPRPARFAAAMAAASLRTRTGTEREASSRLPSDSCVMLAAVQS